MSNAIEKAAKWWADQLFGDTTLDNGVALHGVVAKMGESKKPGPEEKEKYIDAFVSSVSGFWNGQSEFELYVDYNPDQALREIELKAELSCAFPEYPWKTVMLFRCGYILLSHGYAKPLDVFWAEDGVVFYHFEANKTPGQTLRAYRDLRVNPDSLYGTRIYYDGSVGYFWGIGKTEREATENCLRAELEYFGAQNA